MTGFQLKPHMLLGAASAATQIEGGALASSWVDWWRSGHIKDGSSPVAADDHYNRWGEDMELMRTMGIQTYRFGIEWARIEPEEGAFDEDAIAHYREEISAMRTAGIRPLLTLHHFTNPTWFEELGAFEREENQEYFLRFVSRVVEALGDLVSEYITINEPNVYAFNGYGVGDWPPGKKNISLAFTVLTNMAACHVRAYRLIHAQRRQMGFADTKVSFAGHYRAFQPKEAENFTHRALAKTAEFGFQDAMVQAMMLGRCVPPMKYSRHIRPGIYCDFIGVNYYTRSTISALQDGVAEHVNVNDLGWEIYPEGIVVCCEKLHTLAPALPIYITENGTCDNTDAFRARYIYEHLAALCGSELPVERYYHWCFCDNFEWLEGQSARFGLVHVDYAAQTRTVKRSGEFYAAVIREGGVSEALYETYCRTAYPQN